MKKVKVFTLVALFAFLFSATNVFAQPSSAAKFKVVNYSDWTIEYIYFSPTWDDSWGEDKLGEYVLEPQYEYSMTLSEGCGNYDIKLIDEDGDECVVFDVYLCNETWEINSDDLLECYYGENGE